MHLGVDLDGGYVTEVRHRLLLLSRLHLAPSHLRIVVLCRGTVARVPIKQETHVRLTPILYQLTKPTLGCALEWPMSRDDVYGGVRAAGGLGATRAEREVTHLALYAVRHDAAVTGAHRERANFGEDRAARGAPCRCVFSSSNAYSISKRSW